MLAYLIRRTLQIIGVMLGVSFICFIVFQYTGDPVLTITGTQEVTQQQIEEVRKKLGLDLPFYVRYGIFLKRALHGDFGKSYVYRRPVFSLIVERLPASLELVGVAFLFATTVGVGLGILSAVGRGTFISKLFLFGSLVGVSMPTFLSGLLLMMVFSVQLQWFPVFGRGDVLKFGVWNTGLLTVSGLSHLVLPAVTLGLYQLAMLLRLARGEMSEIINEDYVRTAYAKGLRPAKVMLKHAFRNASIPVLTIAGLQLAAYLGFSIITETIFQWPGLGRLLMVALRQNDQPVIVAYIMFIAVCISVVNLLVDVLYAVLDPRVSHG